jgi:SAM-dependent methyltransferase
MSERVPNIACPLCAASDAVARLDVSDRRYFRCAECDLVFVHPDDRPGAQEEAARYLAHQNSRDDAGYVRFLRRLADPVCARMPAGSRGLDVGCGPVPLLGELLTDASRPTVSYDPQFWPATDALGDRYDFVTCSEVVEHAHDPARLFAQLVGLLRPGGMLAVMTSLLVDGTDFKTWWYRRDITHVCFYSEVTMRWIGRRWSLDVELAAPNVVLFVLPAGGGRMRSSRVPIAARLSDSKGAAI